VESLLKKLNYKGTSEVLVLKVPSELAPIVDSFSSEVKVVQDINQIQQIEFALIFALDQKDISDTLPRIKDKLMGDCIVWFCYPKRSSKKYKCDIDRDHGWEILGTYGFEPVRQIAINEDFSALRFRKVANIKNITRSRDMAMTEEAKNRTHMY